MTELIDKQYLTNYLRALLDDLKKDEAFNREWIYGIEKAIEIVDRQEMKQQWVPVSERLPKQGQEVICQCRARIIKVLKLDANGDWYQDADHCYMSGFVIAWMPLPDRYEEMKNDRQVQG